jgi:copper chaperone NosL
MRFTAVTCALAMSACAAAAPRPQQIRLGEDACAHCRMTIVSLATAAQIVAPGSEPLFFDDLGCLTEHLARTPLTDEARVFVADRETGEWIDQRDAVITKEHESTPMGSGLVARRRIAAPRVTP